MGFSSTLPWSRFSTLSPEVSSVIDSVNVRPCEFVSTKRKYDTFSAEFDEKTVEDQKGFMGRSKNAWTPSRLRKLIRMYQMTSLSVDEIVEVLRTRDFKPW